MALYSTGVILPNKELDGIYYTFMWCYWMCFVSSTENKMKNLDQPGKTVSIHNCMYKEYETQMQLHLNFIPFVYFLISS